MLNNWIHRYQQHPFHMVNPSPWPILTAFALFLALFGTGLNVHGYTKGLFIMNFGLFFVVILLILWWRDIVREASFEGLHTSYVHRSIKFGMILFIVSEVFFFLAFFWAFFHAGLNPVQEIGGVWPPKGIFPLNPQHVPLLNTFILLNSGAFVTWVHYGVINQLRHQTIVAFFYTIGLAIFFTALQVYEYCNALFNISDSVFGSVFYMTTGLHGSHVLVGSIFLTVCLIRLIKHQFTVTNHVGLECAIWYWHFVDIVWIFLYSFYYLWSYKY